MKVAYKEHIRIGIIGLLLRPGAAIDADTRGLLEQYLQADGDYRIDLSGQF